MNSDDLNPLILKGFSTRQIAETLGSSQTNVRHHLKRLGLKTQHNLRGQKLPKVKPCEYCEKALENKSSRFCDKDCHTQYKWEFETVPKILKGESGAATCKKYLLLKDPFCSTPSCRQGETWNGQPLSLQLDHVDGDSDNNLPENLRLLCPNCHTQTPTFGARNHGNKSSRNHKMDEWRKNNKSG